MGRDDIDKKLIGFYGEMELALKLHKEGWQVYRAYIDELIDFVISRYYCLKCRKYTKLLKRKRKYNKKERNCLTNLCSQCKKDKVILKTKFIQVKSSAGNEKEDFSFHPKLSHMIKDLYCIWIFIRNHNNPKKPIKCDFFVFEGFEIAKIDNINLDCYQITDNQKISLKIDDEGNVKTKGVWKKLNHFKDFSLLES